MTTFDLWRSDPPDYGPEPLPEHWRQAERELGPDADHEAVERRAYALLAQFLESERYEAELAAAESRYAD